MRRFTRFTKAGPANTITYNTVHKHYEVHPLTKMNYSDVSSVISVSCGNLVSIRHSVEVVGMSVVVVNK